jgi:hypothetical protein
MNKLGVLLAVLLLPASALAQSFPADGDWTPLYCGGRVMHDPLGDVPDALAERDLVGDDDRPTGFRAADADFLYLRMRVDVDPAPGGTVTPYAWGMEIDLDGDLTDYELLLMADGISGEILVFTNTTTTMPNAASDPADTPAVETFPFATHGLVSVAAGGGDDHDLSIAVPWASLAPLGLTPDQRVFVWAATSGTSARLDGDVACRAGAGGLDEAASDPTVLDPGLDSDDDGFSDDDEVRGGSDPHDASSFPGATASGEVLAGGGGCAIGAAPRSGPGTFLALTLGLGLGLASRRRRQARAGNDLGAG